METKDQNGNINCVGCEDCRNCVNCINCKGCQGCVNCTGCNNCYSCVGCTDCNNCDRCTDSTSCNNCYSCIACDSENNIYYLDCTPEETLISLSNSKLGYLVKNSTLGLLSVKDVDTAKGIVQFYAGTYEKDDGNDIILKSAYTKTLSENMARIKHFKNHDKNLTPGVPQSIECDTKGLLVTSLLMPSTLGKDTLIEYEYKAITEHSQGYKPVAGKIETKDGVRILKEVELWEVTSLNAWGMNSDTPTVSLKNKSLGDIADHAKALHNILHKSSISDDRAITLEKELNLILKHLTSLKPNLFTSEPNIGNSIWNAINKSN